MIGRVGEKETGTPLVNSISKMSLFRLLLSCSPIIRTFLEKIIKMNDPFLNKINKTNFYQILINYNCQLYY